MTGDGRVRSPAPGFYISYWKHRENRDSALEQSRNPHPGEAYEALPDDAERPSELTIRPRYAEDTTTAWVSASIEDVVTLEALR